MDKLAIIGASTGQLPLCKKAKEMGLETYCFAWEKGAVCKDHVDHFYPISIMEMDKIANICKQEGVKGVVSNGSDITQEVASYVAGKLSLNCTPYATLRLLRDKYYVRSICKDIENLSMPSYYKYEGKDKNIYPCVVKPCVGGAKKGVSYVRNKEELPKALQYASTGDGGGIDIEEFIEGKEVSVESISFHGYHTIFQITDKDSSGAPHFVELGHHQPANLPSDIYNKIHEVIPQILTAIGYTNGASHIELKYNSRGVFLIEANLRGGGDEISNRLTEMSTGLDYLRSMIEVALDVYRKPFKTGAPHYAGIYYLCKQTANLLPAFLSAIDKPWCIEVDVVSTQLQESFSNYERNGHLIYLSDHKICL
jgi:biotin carboxylase